MYDHTRQYRCTIIRGKSQKEMDDLLPVYALVVSTVCPCPVDDFEVRFNNEFIKYRQDTDATKKTLDNHRTEIAGKLFGMYYKSFDGMVYESERTKKYLVDSDQPAFFKDVCYKMQFPNGMQNISTLKERIENRINIRPNAFVLKLLLIARRARTDITIDEIGYYVLNSLDVLQGKATPDEVLREIRKAHLKRIERKIVVEGKASSYTFQHIREQINYLEVANLVRIDDERRLCLNMRELETINLFADCWNKSPAFNVYSYDLSTVDKRKEFELDWDKYYSQLSEVAGRFETKASALIREDAADYAPQSDQQQPVQPHPGQGDGRENLTELGDEGEEIVFLYEKARVKAYNPRLANKVIPLGKQRGLGYDIQSVIAEPGEMEEYVKYIEVKSTKRVTPPDSSDFSWTDTVNITRNEWVAAMQHKEFYSIYRLYFSRAGVTAFVLNNIWQKHQDGKLVPVPLTYKVDFKKDAVDSVIILRE